MTSSLTATGRRRTGTGRLVQTSGGQTTPPPAHAAYGEPAPYGQAPHSPVVDQQTQVFGTVAAAQPLPAAEPEAAAYGPATVTGNPRVTDAQRARAEGRSPIIEPGMQPAALTALLGLLLAGGAAVGQYALLVPLVLLQAVTAAALVPAQRHVAGRGRASRSPSRAASPPTPRCSSPAGRTRPPRSSAPSASGSCSRSSSSSAVTRHRTSACTA